MAGEDRAPRCGEIVPDKGTVKHGTRLEIIYFDQLREQLDENATVEENVADGKDTIIINNMPRHVIGYLKDFLFTPERARSPVKILSFPPHCLFPELYNSV